MPLLLKPGFGKDKKSGNQADSTTEIVWYILCKNISHNVHNFSNKAGTNPEPAFSNSPTPLPLFRYQLKIIGPAQNRTFSAFNQ